MEIDELMEEINGKRKRNGWKVNKRKEWNDQWKDKLNNDDDD